MQARALEIDASSTNLASQPSTTSTSSSTIGTPSPTAAEDRDPYFISSCYEHCYDASNNVSARCQDYASNSLAMNCVDSLLDCNTLAKVLLPDRFLENSKLVLGFFVGGNAMFILIIWMPLYFFSEYVLANVLPWGHHGGGEVGMYILLIMLVGFIGRKIIRLIAFPGATARVQDEIQMEFAKYAIRTLDSTCEEFIEFASMVQHQSSRTTSLSFLLKTKWEKMDLYRRRIIAVFIMVISRLLDDDDEEVESLFRQINNDKDDVRQCFDAYGNNILVGDIGSYFDCLFEDAIAFRGLLLRILACLNSIKKPVEESVKYKNRFTTNAESNNNELHDAAKELRRASMELRDLLPSLLHNNPNSEDNSEDDSVQSSNFEMMKSSFSSIIPFLDPQRYESVFSLDLIRGCVLSRYQEAKQIWVNDRIDCLHFPAPNAYRKEGKKRAIIYCNPNAGLCEMTNGIDFFGGNIEGQHNDEDMSCWADFYLYKLGFDIFFFNYSGYGRSSGDHFMQQCKFLNKTRLGRLLWSMICFQPSPESVKEDAVSVIEYVQNLGDFQEVIVHGESIGGMAASSAVSFLTAEKATPGKKVSLLICDRTFCNIEAIAQRLVGGWTASAIRCLVPFWNTDNAGNFMSSACPKIFATDCADVIIADASSLKSGIAVASELNGSLTKDICWKRQTPFQYRLAEHDDQGLSEMICASFNRRFVYPSWPEDKRLSIDAAYLFAFSSRRIGKLATAAKRGTLHKKYAFKSNTEEGFEVSQHDTNDDEESLRISDSFSSNEVVCALVDLWYCLGCCDGLCGAPLAHAVKHGIDETVTWLCNAAVFGGQQLVSAAEARIKGKVDSIQSIDFKKPHSGEGYQLVAMPSVVEKCEFVLQRFCNGDNLIALLLKEEIQCVRDTLQYLISRLSAKENVISAYSSRNFDNATNGKMSRGCFINLRCGHNMMYSEEEQDLLQRLIEKACSDNFLAV